VLTRFFLGFVEAPFFPGALFLLTSWYTKKELAFRTAVLYSGSLLSGAFGGFVGAGIEAGLDGYMGWKSWRWLFVIESSATIVLAAGAMFILPDYPATTRWLLPSERSLAVQRLQSQSLASRHGIQKEGLLNGLKQAMTDPKVALLALIILTKTSAGAVTSFIPTLVATFNLSHVSTLLLVAPPYIAAAITGLVVSRSSDKHSERSLHIILPITLGLAGFALFGLTLNSIARYLSMFLMLSGVYGSYNVALAWISSTIPEPVAKKSAAYAIINTVGNMAQIYSPYLYLAENGPRYAGAMVADAGFCLACVGFVWVLRVRLTRENKMLPDGHRYLI
jgi:MFS family permease